MFFRQFILTLVQNGSHYQRREIPLKMIHKVIKQIP